MTLRPNHCHTVSLFRFISLSLGQAFAAYVMVLFGTTIILKVYCFSKYLFIVGYDLSTRFTKAHVAYVTTYFLSLLYFIISFFFLSVCFQVSPLCFSGLPSYTEVKFVLAVVVVERVVEVGVGGRGILAFMQRNNKTEKKKGRIMRKCHLSLFVFFFFPLSFAAVAPLVALMKRKSIHPCATLSSRLTLPCKLSYSLACLACCHGLSVCRCWIFLLLLLLLSSFNLHQ